MLALSSSHDCESLNISKIKFNQLVCSVVLRDEIHWDTHSLDFMVIKSVKELGSQRQGLPWRRPGSIHCNDKVPTIKKNMAFEKVYESYISEDCYQYDVCFFYLVVRTKKRSKDDSLISILFQRAAILKAGRYTGNAEGIPGFLTNTVMSRCPNMSFRVASLCLIHTMAKGSFKVFSMTLV